MIKQVNITVELNLEKNLSGDTHEGRVEKSLEYIKKIDDELQKCTSTTIATHVDMKIVTF